MIKIIPAFLLLTAPVSLFAQQLTQVDSLLTSIGGLVSTALPILVGLALLGFFWGLVKFIFAQGNEDSKTDAKKIMIWGLVALFVMVSVWGLVGFIGDAFDIEQGDDLTEVPTVPGLGV